MVRTYECTQCKKKVSTADNQKPPQCCGKTMKQLPLDICTQPAHAEHARPMVAMDACDDFRGGVSEESNDESKSMVTCALCDCEIEESSAKSLKIKGNVKHVCPGCATAVKGIA